LDGKVPQVKAFVSNAETTMTANPIRGQKTFSITGSGQAIFTGTAAPFACGRLLLGLFRVSRWWFREGAVPTIASP
jgi:hypothetical protein